MPLPDILQFIGMGEKTGTLRLTCAPARKELHFEGGVAVCCSSNNPKEYLGQHLLARTSLTEADLEAAFRAQRQSGQPLGRVLVEQGRLTEDELDRVLARKIEDAMYEAFTWSEGEFEFVEGELDPRAVPIRVPIDWQNLIMEGARRADEMGRIRQAIPGDGARFDVHPDRFPPGFPKSGGDKKLLHLAGRGLSAGDICARFHLSDFDVLSRLADLCQRGLISVDAESTAASSGPDRNETLELGSRLLSEARLLEALQLFQTGLERFPGDRSFETGLAKVKHELEHAFSEPEGVVPELAASLDELTDAGLDSKQAFVISRVNGQWSLRSIAQICPFDELDVLATLHELCRRGLVRVERPVVA